MGYAQYFTIKTAPTKEQIEKFTSMVKLIISKSTVAIVDGMGTNNTLPEITNDAVIFNGEGDDSHETFFMEFNDLEWNFVKTNRKPYDTVVTAVLHCASDIMDIEIDSDGDEEDKEEGIALYKSCKT